MSETPPFDALLRDTLQAAWSGGQAALALRDAGDITATRKADGTPATNADLAAETLILDHLQAQLPRIPILSEERWQASDPPIARALRFLVDPIDGTRNFLADDDEFKDDFSVNIALVEGDAPLFGLIYAPARGIAWWGACGRGAHTAQITDGVPREAPRELHRLAEAHTPPRIVQGHWSGKSALRLLTSEGIHDVGEILKVGAALKFCTLAESQADIYPRAQGSKEWDTAAGQAILEAVGGAVLVAPEGTSLRYGKPGLENPNFIAWRIAP